MMDEYQQAVRSTETAFAAFRYALERLEKAKDAAHELEQAAHAARAHEVDILTRLRASVV